MDDSTQERSLTDLDGPEFDELMMASAIELARRGAGWVSPNPMVGALIVGANREVIAEGWHRLYGGPHAEVDALTAAAGRDLSEATMYVSLEPCSHVGKTPPCSEAIIASGIRRVVVAMRDPNPIVSGRGNRALREAGVHVEVGMMEREARTLNEAYIHRTETGLPFVTIKMAQTLDGFSALPSGESKWITGEGARRRVHWLRAASDAIMVGTHTAIVDNPQLNLRYGVEGRQPRRFTVDRELAIPATHHLVADEHRALTTIFTTEAMSSGARARALRESGVNVVGVPLTGHGVMLSEVFRIISEMDVASVLVEGGSRLAGALITEGLAQKLVLFVGPKLFGHGFPTIADLDVEHVREAWSLSYSQVEPIGEDLMIEAYIVGKGG